MKPDELPQPLADWLQEPEDFHLRIERLYEEMKMDPAPRVLDWLLVAYELGLAEGRKVSSP
ncbi:hypothetical protein [Rhizobacter sp. SG703]|uniref:hypothetical protein n=1 Tax=Rhizobacter sp. SG703 TaxID=2587140 RepID=UPI001445B155|nr:hypothetical protein [Rhizobacter sp. SG703]NKI93904.1 hypothetical protein [Rhizobacter sp. SG703]